MKRSPRRSRISILSSTLALLGAQAGWAALEPEPVVPRLLLDTAGLADDVDPGEIFATAGDVAFFYLWERDEQGTPGLTELDDDTLRIGLWRTDGTADGTFPLIAPDSSLYYYSDVLDGVLYFALCEPESPIYLFGPYLCDLPSNVHFWRTDGTPEGTYRVLEGSSRALGFAGFVTRAVPELGLLFFATVTQGPGYELWATDGTRDGTRLVTNLSTRGFAYPRRLQSSGGELVFQATEASEPFGTWLGRSDGTAEGTELTPAPFDGEIEVVDLEGGGSRSFLLGRGPEQNVTPGGIVYRNTLWSLGDGPEPRFLGDLGLLPRTVTPSLRTGNDRAFLRFYDFRTNRLSLWGSDGTEGGAELLADVPAGTFLSLFVWRDALALPQGAGFLALEDEAHGIEPWITDGTSAGTTRLADVCPGQCDSNPGGLGTAPGDSFVFGADDGVHGWEPWSWRPAKGSVARIADLCPGECSTDLRWIGSLADRAYVVEIDPVGSQTVWALDPAAGTEPRPVADVGGLRIDRFNVLFVITGASWIVRDESWTFWGSRDDCPLCLWTVPLGADPPPPPGPALTSERLPGFAVKVRIGGADGRAGRAEADCIPETLCVSGALPGRSEVFVRVVGPKPNGKLWPTLVKFTTSTVEVWIEQLATGLVRYYHLEGASPGSSDLPGLFDRNGFPPG